MDALAITTLCLRVSFSLDNRVGYIPLWDDDPAYIAEQDREKKAGMPQCRCSNCSPAKAENLIQSLSVANNENFDDILNDNFSLPNIYNIKYKYPQKAAMVKKRKFTEEDEAEINEFATLLMSDFHYHYNTNIRPGGSTQGSDIFDKDDCKAILAQLDTITNSLELKRLIGGDCFLGQSAWLFAWLSNYRLSNVNNCSTTKTPLISQKPKRPCGPAKSGSIRNPCSAKQLGVPRPPTKKELAAQESRKRSLARQEAKKKEDELNQRRREQVQQIMAASREAHCIAQGTSTR
ncbi:uncharacterized protein PGTG_02253 [Puccinia graminis f. sp. tritici CRL 75-36-700-3]|uniref:ATP-dependent DNA helicase sgs1 n=1 Tax=Puccinia graminis f. sp. tritici (strain CRL 75-36-700-3 / race SCCL) TaxID=418459 RepID=E3JXL7_PUCGT|nr:uncharacterized protein PGTG_02253 [Puccinia graminis f. sp. tritici CRL 75-36-700-3]EFP76792.1 hypothetical protein PGTG_02253 [Puccinia graminis f. sp. tritici CRL 75-36-700-3]